MVPRFTAASCVPQVSHRSDGKIKEQNELTKQYAAYLEALMLVHGTALEVVQKVKDIADDAGDEIFIALVATLIEYANAALLLASKKTSAGDDSMFRSFLEGFVDLKNLAEDKYYRYVLLLDYHKQWITLLKSASSGNEFLKGIAEHESYKEQLANHESQLKWLNKKHVQSMTRFAKFRKAEMEAEYRSIYNFTSGEAHNNMRALFRRNLDFNEEGWVVKINYWSPDRCVTRFDAYSGLLIQAMKMTNVRFKLDANGQIEAATEKLSAARDIDVDG